MFTKTLALLAICLLAAVVLELVFGVQIGLVRWTHQAASHLDFHLIPGA